MDNMQNAAAAISLHRRTTTRAVFVSVNSDAFIVSWVFPFHAIADSSIAILCLTGHHVTTHHRIK